MGQMQKQVLDVWNWILALKYRSSWSFDKASEVHRTRDRGASRSSKRLMRQTAYGPQVGLVEAFLPKDAANSSQLCCHPFHPALSRESFLSLRYRSRQGAVCKLDVSAKRSQHPLLCTCFGPEGGSFLPHPSRRCTMAESRVRLNTHVVPWVSPTSGPQWRSLWLGKQVEEPHFFGWAGCLVRSCWWWSQMQLLEEAVVCQKNMKTARYWEGQWGDEEKH